MSRLLVPKDPLAQAFETQVFPKRIHLRIDVQQTKCCGIFVAGAFQFLEGQIPFSQRVVQQGYKIGIHVFGFANPFYFSENVASLTLPPVPGEASGFKGPEPVEIR